MESIDVYIYIVIGILGVAYPVLLQVVARLDEKYASDKIVQLFNSENENRWFRNFLISSLCILLLWTLRLPAIVHFEHLDFLIENSASILLGISTILLVISFFYFVKKILIYYIPTRFIPYLIGRHEKSDDDIQYFTALSELLLLFIKKQETNYSKTLSDFFYIAYRKIRDQQTGKPVIYPELYYEVVYKAIEELAILKEKRNFLLEHRTSGEIWLLGELQGAEISEETYSWMWRNILLAIRYEQDDLIINHWETCHQYYVYRLPYFSPKHDIANGANQVSNQEEVSKRSAERKRFITFHYVLGGLLMYKERYRCLKRIFSYTQSYPPKYELLPESMSKIFDFYFEVRDPYERNHPWISHNYHFPEISGLNGDFSVKRWIMSYMAILFLRQYTIQPYLITMKPLAFPRIPDTQGKIREWIDGMDLFKRLVSDHLNNDMLLRTLGLDFITVEWCEQAQKPFPLTFIDDFKSKLEATYDENALNLEITVEKAKQFKEKTAKSIESTWKILLEVSNTSLIEDENSDSWYVGGRTILQSKDSFSESPEVYNLNYDTILGSAVSEEIYDAYSYGLFYKKTRSFLLKPEDIFKAIDKLKIDDSYVILNFGFDLDYFVNHLKVTGLSDKEYKGASIFSLSSSHIVRDSAFILRKTDLPNISTNVIDENVIEKYSLDRISDDIELYASVIDMNETTAEIFDEYSHGISEGDARKSALLTVMLSAEFKWKKNVEIIQLIQYWEYSQRGIVNKLGDIEPFSEPNE